MERRKDFTTLEGMRGVAAIGIVLFHGDRLYGAASPASGYLAVDFFFVLSGFIMAHSYGGRLDAGLPPLAFLRARIVRLYPLYLAGTLSTVGYAVASILVRHQHTLWAYTRPLVSVPPALLMLPSPAADVLFPLDVPAWTLLLELLANAVFAVRALRQPAVLTGLAAVSAVGVAASAVICGGLNVGWDFATAAAGLARVFVSFPLGVLLHRVHRRIHLPQAAWPAPLAVLGVLLAAAPSGAGRVAFDLAFVALASPALLLAAAASNPAGRTRRRVLLFLGATSYPLYALHYPTLIAVTGVIERAAGAGRAHPVAGLAVLAGLLAMAWAAAVADRWLALRIAARIGLAVRRRVAPR